MGLIAARVVDGPIMFSITEFSSVLGNLVRAEDGHFTICIFPLHESLHALLGSDWGNG